MNVTFDVIGRFLRQMGEGGAGRRAFLSRMALGAAASIAQLPGASASDPAPEFVFVTQTPNPLGDLDYATVTAPFGSHRGTTEAAPRGGSLYVLYSDGSVVNILDRALKAACDLGSPLCEPEGYRALNEDGVLVHGVAVRAPTVHWNGDRILFSMSIGAVQPAERYRVHEFNWRLYEIEGISREAVPVITEVAHQPQGYNNIDPVYGSREGRIFFTSDRPVTGAAIHYPQLDEYESTPTVSGLWSLDVNDGTLTLLDHSPSGAFNPLLDRSGHIVYTRWDHLQADQQANAALAHVADNSQTDRFTPYTYDNEGDVGPQAFETVADRIRAALALSPPDYARAFDLGEPFAPEPHHLNPAYVNPELRPEGASFGAFNGLDLVTRAPADAAGRRFRPFQMSTFTPWQIKQDGARHMSLRHVGRHETLEYLAPTFLDDPALSEAGVRRNLWAFNMSEDPAAPGRYLANSSTASRRHAAGAIFSIEDTAPTSAGDHENADALSFAWLTDPAGDILYRDPLWTEEGELIAAVDAVPLSAKTRSWDPYQFEFELRRLVQPAGESYFEPGARLTSPITASFQYYEGGGTGRLRRFEGPMWMLQPVEVSARPRPPLTAGAVEAIEAGAITAAGVAVAELQAYLRERSLALLVVRNATRRDDADRQQPYNLVVDHPTEPDGAAAGDGECVLALRNPCAYPVTFMPLYANKFVRGYARFASNVDGEYRDGGRRGLARPVNRAEALEFNNPLAPDGRGLVAPDGSVAVLAPAGRALTWSLTDADGSPIVRERIWLTLKAGEIRSCGGCHGANELDQTGGPPVQSEAQALGALLGRMKSAGAFDD